MRDVDAAVVGAGVVGCAVALALARRGAVVALLEAQPAPGLGASGTNSGVLHTGFDSVAGELETELILRSARLRDPVLDALGVPVVRCGAVLRPLSAADRPAVEDLAANAQRNGVPVRIEAGALQVQGEAVTDPVAFTLGLAAAAVRHGAQLRTGFRVGGLRRDAAGLALEDEGGSRIGCRVAVNCAGLHADQVARMAGDDSFEVYPRKGEFLVFEPPDGRPLERILLPVPSRGTKGVLVFPTVDGRIAAGPTAVDQEDKDDWSVRPEARDEIMPRAIAMHPRLDGAEPIAAYAGLRPAGRGVNYLIGRSRACEALINVAAIRSTGLTASLGIAERACDLVEALGVRLGPERPLEPGRPPPAPGPWWRRTAEHVAG